MHGKQHAFLFTSHSDILNANMPPSGPFNQSASWYRLLKKYPISSLFLATILFYDLQQTVQLVTVLLCNCGHTGKACSAVRRLQTPAFQKTIQVLHVCMFMLQSPNLSINPKLWCCYKTVQFMTSSVFGAVYKGSLYVLVNRNCTEWNGTKPTISTESVFKNSKCYFWNCDGVEVQWANFDLLEEEIKLGAPWSRLATKGQRVAIGELPLDAKLEADLIDPGAWNTTAEEMKSLFF